MYGVLANMVDGVGGAIRMGTVCSDTKSSRLYNAVEY
jgi:hypothetical protein